MNKRKGPLTEVEPTITTPSHIDMLKRINIIKNVGHKQILLDSFNKYMIATTDFTTCLWDCGEMNNNPEDRKIMSSIIEDLIKASTV